MAKNVVRGVKKFNARLGRLSKTAPKAVVEQMLDNSRDLLNRAAALTPRLSGDLEFSGKITRVKQSRDRTRFRVEFGNTKTEAYIRFIHDGEYNLGPISRLKPPTPDGLVGPGFLSRPARFHAVRYRGLLQKRLNEHVRKQARRR